MGKKGRKEGKKKEIFLAIQYSGNVPKKIPVPLAVRNLHTLQLTLDNLEQCNLLTFFSH